MEKPTNPTPQKQAETVKEKVPGPVMRVAIRAQAAVNLIMAVWAPIESVKAIKNKHYTVPWLSEHMPQLKDIDLSSPLRRVATVAIGVFTTGYGALNAISRWRAANDAATQEKISRGTVQMHEVKISSNRFDIFMTRMNAIVGTVGSVIGGGFALHQINSATGRGTPMNNTEKLTIATGLIGAVVGPVLGLPKWRAADAAQRLLERREAAVVANSVQAGSSPEAIAQQITAVADPTADLTKSAKAASAPETASQPRNGHVAKIESRRTAQPSGMGIGE